MHPALGGSCGSAGLRVLAVFCLAICAQIPAANAAITISTQTTRNMSCSAGVCMPTAKNAVLNAADLETMLASGNATITTTGSIFQANDIVVAAPLSWSTPNTLAFDANRRLAINAPLVVKDMGVLALLDDGGIASLYFGAGGNVTFANLSSSLLINGTSYTLVSKIASLANAIRSNPSGAFALAKSYNAKKDGTYSASPIATEFTGNFEGLGNTISNLTINDASDSEVGLFAYVNGGYLHDIGLKNVNVTSGASSVILGALVGFMVGAPVQDSSYSGVITGSWSSGTLGATASTYAQLGGLAGSACNSGNGYELDGVINSHSSVNIAGGHSNFAGGLVGYSCGSGLIEQSYATGVVTAGDCSYAGGLVGGSTAYVEDSFATGAATTGDTGQCGPPPSAGGLVGYNFGVSGSPGTITNSYSSGPASGGSGSNVGGVVGYSYEGTISNSYSIGAPSGGGYVGGLIGYDNSAALADTYWDTDTSGVASLSQGAGNISNAPGITGLSTSQLQSGLPQGFKKFIWKQDKKINDGLPYLANNPPVK